MRNLKKFIGMLGVLCGLASALQAKNELSFSEKASVGKGPDGSEVIVFDLNPPAVQDPRISKIRVRLNAEGKITHFDTEWTNPRAIGTFTLKRPISEKYQRLRTAIDIQAPSGDLTEFRTIEDRTFQVITSEEMGNDLKRPLRRLGPELQRERINEFVRESRNFYFGVRRQKSDPSQVQILRDRTEIPTKDAILKIAGDNQEFAEHNRFVLADIQRRVKQTAIHMSAYAPTASTRNHIVLKDFVEHLPNLPGEDATQELAIPPELEEKKVGYNRDLPMGPGFDKAPAGGKAQDFRSEPKRQSK